MPVLSGVAGKGLPVGLTGALTATRYAGGNASGAPASGTFAVGDFVVNADGSIFVCTVAGSPGTWVDTATIGPSVASVFGRTGTVTAGNADYLAVASGGLTGAVAATRYVGGTASGSPGSGTFAVGDFVIDQTGKVWICTAAGTPGTWAQAGVAGSIGTEYSGTYVEFTSTVACTATTEATANTVVTAGAVTFNGTDIVLIEFYCFAWDLNSTTANARIVLYDGASSIGQMWQSTLIAASGSTSAGIYVARRLTPSNASHTYSIRGYVTVASTFDVGAGAGGNGNGMPGWIRITRAA